MGKWHCKDVAPATQMVYALTITSLPPSLPPSIPYRPLEVLLGRVVYLGVGKELASHDVGRGLGRERRREGHEL